MPNEDYLFNNDDYINLSKPSEHYLHIIDDYYIPIDDYPPSNDDYKSNWRISTFNWWLCFPKASRVSISDVNKQYQDGEFQLPSGELISLL